MVGRCGLGRGFRGAELHERQHMSFADTAPTCWQPKQQAEASDSLPARTAGKKELQQEKKRRLWFNKRQEIWLRSGLRSPDASVLLLQAGTHAHTHRRQRRQSGTNKQPSGASDRRQHKKAITAQQTIKNDRMNE